MSRITEPEKGEANMLGFRFEVANVDTSVFRTSNYRYLVVKTFENEWIVDQVHDSFASLMMLIMMRMRDHKDYVEGCMILDTHAAPGQMAMMWLQRSRVGNMFRWQTDSKGKAYTGGVDEGVSLMASIPQSEKDEVKDCLESLMLCLPVGLNM